MYNNCILILQVGPGFDAKGNQATVALETNSVVQPTSEENYMFDLQSFAPRLLQWLQQHPDGTNVLKMVTGGVLWVFL
jgi:methionyl-tRNA synthetase